MLYYVLVLWLPISIFKACSQEKLFGMSGVLQLWMQVKPSEHFFVYLQQVLFFDLLNVIN